MLSWLIQTWNALFFLLTGFGHTINDRFCRRRAAYRWEAQLDKLLKGSYTHLEGQWVVITGANAGIGYQLALQLARCGVSVILACRSEARGKEAERSILEKLGKQSKARVEYVNLDVSDLRSVTRFSKEMDGRGVGMLVCNAGAMCLPWSLTPQGFETVFGTHVIGHALLAQLLMPEILRSSKGSARIIYVSSRTVEDGVFLPEYFVPSKEEPKNWNRFTHYGNVKTSQTCCALALADELGAGDVAVHAVHPGCVHSDITLNSGMPLRRMMDWGASLVNISAVEGASYVLRVCLAEDCAPAAGTGRYYHCGHLSQPGPAASRVSVRKEAWGLLQKALSDGGWLPSATNGTH